EVEELVTRRVAEEMEAREAVMNLEPMKVKGGNGGNGGNGNGGNGGNRNGGTEEMEMEETEKMEMETEIGIMELKALSD
ncbi:hypothetical protein Tco_0333675, partial [Tanacetum coccineum]